ncbi:MAG TPA: PQQ-binding-like beta-propeller repeat protein [Acidothermaceae bacterium]|jgi:outer membrane protein assembly factor BamB
MQRAAAILSSLALLAGASVSAASSAQAATTASYYGAGDYQVDATHQGNAGPALSAALKVKWTKDFGGTVSYPVIVGGRMYFTVQHLNDLGSDLYAVVATTGAKVWGPVALAYGSTGYSALSYDGGRVFAMIGNGNLRAFDAATGKLDWSVQLPYEGNFTSPPTASGGVVYVGGSGSGGKLYAVSESTGVVKWMQEVMNGAHSAPAVGGGGVYVSYSAELSYRFSTTGQLVWTHTAGGEGGGGRTAVLHGSQLWVRDDAGMTPAILDTATGKQVRTFQSATAPAFAGNTAFVVANDGLQAINATTGKTLWNQHGDGGLESAPEVAGATVYIGSGFGKIFGYSTTTGKQVWEASTGATFVGPDEHNGSVLQGLQIGDGLLAVPATTRMTVFG